MTDLNPMRSGNTNTNATTHAASTDSENLTVRQPPEWVDRYLRLSPRLRRGYRQFLGTLPDEPQRLSDLDEQVSWWPADVKDTQSRGQG